MPDQYYMELNSNYAFKCNHGCQVPQHLELKQGAKQRMRQEMERSGVQQLPGGGAARRGGRK